ncbi:ParB N-terminal domain-containing protein [Streptomyces triculaminicus]|uniref:ParB/RepB/Spo0J family partition protein n=1 Tax=Streptomyces triculaminicus TaxID=2816232 RepID=UPI003409D777
MATHDEFDDFFDDHDDNSAVDTRADGRLLRVPVARIAPNLVNPRTNFGSEEELQDLGKSLQRRQVQAVLVVTRAAYLKLWPENAEKVGNVDVVIVSGERRYRAAKAVAMPALDCVINDDVAESRKTFIEAVVSENVDRANFDPIEEAYAIEALVAEFGTGRAVAQHFERADGWVSQRRLLTHLVPALQDQVRQRTMPVEVARNLGKLARDNEWSAEEQAAWWAKEQQKRQEAVEERKAQKQEGKREAKAKTPQTKEVQPRDEESLAAIPWHNPTAVLNILRERMSSSDFERLVKEAVELI